jgi:hypothetical protein
MDDVTTNIEETPAVAVESIDPTAEIADVEAVLTDIAKSLAASVQHTAVTAEEVVQVMVVPPTDDVATHATVDAADDSATNNIVKSLGNIEAMLTAISDRLTAVETLAKSLAPINQAPVDIVAKAITAQAAVSPLDAAPAAPAVTRQVVLNRAVDELAKCDNIARRVELRKAIARLETGFPPAEVANDLRFTL